MHFRWRKRYATFLNDTTRLWAIHLKPAQAVFISALLLHLRYSPRERCRGEATEGALSWPKVLLETVNGKRFSADWKWTQGGSGRILGESVGGALGGPHPAESLSLRLFRPITLAYLKRGRGPRALAYASRPSVSAAFPPRPLRLTLPFLAQSPA